MTQISVSFGNVSFEISTDLSAASELDTESRLNTATTTVNLRIDTLSGREHGDRRRKGICDHRRAVEMGRAGERRRSGRRFATTGNRSSKSNSRIAR